MANKITKKEISTMIIALINSVEYEKKDEMLDFLKREVELLNNEESKLEQITFQKENETLIETVFEALATVNKPITITELQSKIPAMAEYSNKKLSAILKKLIIDGRVCKIVGEKECYFFLSSSYFFLSLEDIAEEIEELIISLEDKLS